uniref:Uncharacterized protein n=1 Tax=Pararge aegeria TaxID=116150 RepID=S4PKQ6_9NEOP
MKFQIINYISTKAGRTLTMYRLRRRACSSIVILLVQRPNTATSEVSMLVYLSSLITSSVSLLYETVHIKQKPIVSSSRFQHDIKLIKGAI